MTIRVEIKQVYGKDTIYPLTNQEALQQLTGNKTLTATSVKALKALGFTFEIVQKSTL